MSAPCQIVLAAGRSRRMGQPKPLLRFGDRTALELVLGAAAEAGVGPRIVVVGAAADEVIAAHAGAAAASGVIWARNPDEASEQLRSLQIGIEAARRAAGPDAGFFIQPADHPLALASDYRLLLEALERDGGASTVFIPSHGGRRGHPVLCRASVGTRILALPDSATARDVIETERIAFVPTPNAAVREDMDAPADYERLLALHRRRPAGGEASEGP